MINNQNCFAVNFGFSGEIPLPTFCHTFANNQKLQQYDLGESFTCFYVFVGGKYVKVIKNVIEIVEAISGQFNGVRPKGMFIMGKFNTSNIKNISTLVPELTKVVIMILVSTIF